MGKQTNGQLMAISPTFDYSCLRPKVAEKVRTVAHGIRRAISQAVHSVIDAGHGLLTVKGILPHGQFGHWLELEFGWSDRHARRLMDVAETFGPKSDSMSDLPIMPTALYILASPSTPFEARETAIERAKAGEKITPSIATEIIAVTRKATPRNGKALSPDRFLRALRLTLARFQKRCPPDKVLEYARYLRECAQELEQAAQSFGRRVMSVAIGHNGKQRVI